MAGRMLKWKSLSTQHPSHSTAFKDSSAWLASLFTPFQEPNWGNNSEFQITSFGHNPIQHGHFKPTFTIQGQTYHLIGSLLLTEVSAHNFLSRDPQSNQTKCRAFVKKHGNLRISPGNASRSQPLYLSI